MSDTLGAKFMVYELIDPAIDKVFYVGKGQKGRLDKHLREARQWERDGRPFDDYWKTRNCHRLAKILKIMATGKLPATRVILDTDDEDLAFKKEFDIISEYGLENLTNMSRGGRPDVSSCHTPSVRRRVGESLRGRKRPEEVGRKISEATRGKKRHPLTEEHRQKISEGLLKHGKFGAALNPPKGENAFRAKLTQIQADEIRERIIRGERQWEIALDFNVRQSTISRIWLNQAYVRDPNE